MDTDRTNATIFAAEILIANVMGVLSSLAYSDKQLALSIQPLFAIDWPSAVTSAIGLDRLTRMFTRVEISRFPEVDYRSLLRRITAAPPDASVVFPFCLESWLRAVVRFNLEMTLPSRSGYHSFDR